ncbi:hypothetical protein [Cellulomonas oligotrophica]|uniref:Uncharacterized protein n=1 Tax=Cellulomonas oligotrophica TaxID=931536 RepID=A0A7Y9FI27_9CELL|nr:hypothetical protein [Cellulomonas oligotrophica]NYD87746.1 hypothetical protein [Cellulomonas oligotrophica]
MTLLPLVLLLLPLLAVLVALALVVRRDGLGHRPPPRSHHAWDDRPA